MRIAAPWVMVMMQGVPVWMSSATQREAAVVMRKRMERVRREAWRMARVRGMRDYEKLTSCECAGGVGKGAEWADLSRRYNARWVDRLT
jgi:hypothetical protein